MVWKISNEENLSRWKFALRRTKNETENLYCFELKNANFVREGQEEKMTNIKIKNKNHTVNQIIRIMGWRRGPKDSGQNRIGTFRRGIPHVCFGGGFEVWASKRIMNNLQGA